ncbi:MAG: hypothetical protein IJ280_04685 [Bacteroidales bacterium]|nr:hypothetical protein [Bacteroidales bacterium]
MNKNLNPNLFLHLFAAIALAVIIYLKCYDPKHLCCNVSYIITNLSFGYLGGYMIYAITSLMKNRIERRRHIWQIYDKVKRLHRIISETTYPNKEELILDEDRDDNCKLKYESLQKLQNYLYSIENSINSTEKYYNMLDYDECELFIRIRSIVDTLLDILNDCSVYDKQSEDNVKDSAVLSNKQLENAYAGLREIAEKADHLQSYIIKEIKRIR